MAEREHAALQRLAEKQAATRAEVEAARRRVREAELQIEALERKRGSLVTRNDRSAAQARLRDAEAALQLARERVTETVVRAPMAGVVYDLPVRPGSYVEEGAPIAEIGRLDRLRVRVYVDEPELGRVQVGQPVTITWDAKPGRKWEGTVEKTATQIEALGTRQVGEVAVTIDNPGRELVPGTNVNAEIRTNVAPNALTIPKEALRREGGEVGVFVLREGNTAGVAAGGDGRLERHARSGGEGPERWRRGSAAHRPRADARACGCSRSIREWADFTLCRQALPGRFRMAFAISFLRKSLLLSLSSARNEQGDDDVMRPLERVELRHAVALAAKKDRSPMPLASAT